MTETPEVYSDLPPLIKAALEVAATWPACISYQ